MTGLTAQQYDEYLHPKLRKKRLARSHHIYLTEDMVQLHVRPWYEGPIHSGLLEQIAAIIARWRENRCD